MQMKGPSGEKTQSVWLLQCLPVGGEGTQGRRLVTAAVQLRHCVWGAVFGQYLLVLDGGAFKGLPQVYILE